METTKKLNETPLIQEMTADHTYVIVDSQGNVSRMNDVPKKYVTETELNDFIKPYDNRITTNETDISNLETNMTNVKADITDLETDMTTVKTDTLDLETYIDTITPKNTASGEIAHTTDALPLPVFKTTADGNVEQFTTNGENLFNANVCIYHCLVDEDTITITDDTTDVYVYGTFAYNENNKFMTLEAGNYYIKSTNSNVKVTMYSDGEALDSSATQPRAFTTITNFGGIRIRSIDGSSLKNVSFELKISKDKFTDEPYTGAQASPNPSYPQEIEVLESYNVTPTSFVTNSKITKNGVTLETLGVGSFHIYGTNTSGRFQHTYIPSNKTFENNFTIIQNTSDKISCIYNQIGTLYGTSSINTSSNIAPNVSIYVDKDGEIDEYLTIMMVDGNDKTKPYLPNGCVGYKVNGKNLFNPLDIRSANGLTNVINIDGGITTTGIPNANYVKIFDYVDITDMLENGETYTISQDKMNGVFFQLEVKNNNTGVSNFNINCSSKLSNSFVADTDINTYKICIQNGLKENWTEQRTFTTFFQLEKGSTATPYEPHKEQIVPLDLKGNWVGAINDEIKDYIVTDKKKYWLVKNVGKVVLDGGESGWNYAETYKYFRSSTYDFGDKKPKAWSKTMKQICNRFLMNSTWSGANSFRDNVDVDGEFYPLQDNGYMLAFRNLAFNNVDDFKQWLSENNVIVYYPLATPEIIELGELPEPIKTFEGVNNIQLLANLDTEIEVVYAQDVKKYIDSKLAEISAQII